MARTSASGSGSRIGANALLRHGELAVAPASATKNPLTPQAVLEVAGFRQPVIFSRSCRGGARGSRRPRRDGFAEHAEGVAPGLASEAGVAAEAGRTSPLAQQEQSAPVYRSPRWSPTPAEATDALRAEGRPRADARGAGCAQGPEWLFRSVTWGPELEFLDVIRAVLPPTGCSWRRSAGRFCRRVCVPVQAPRTFLTCGTPRYLGSAIRPPLGRRPLTRPGVVSIAGDWRLHRSRVRRSPTRL